MTTTRQALEELVDAARNLLEKPEQYPERLVGGMYLRNMLSQAESALASAPEPDGELLHLREAAELLRQLVTRDRNQCEAIYTGCADWLDRDAARTPATGKDRCRAERKNPAGAIVRCVLERNHLGVHEGLGGAWPNQGEDYDGRFDAPEPEPASVPAEPPGEVVSHEAVRKAAFSLGGGWGCEETELILAYADQQEQAERLAEKDRGDARMRIVELEAEVAKWREIGGPERSATVARLTTPPSQPTEPTKVIGPTNPATGVRVDATAQPAPLPGGKDGA